MNRLSVLSLGAIAFVVALAIWFGTREPPPKSASGVHQQPDEPTQASVVSVSPKNLVAEQGAPQRVVAEHREIRTGMTRVEDFINAGRATPADAFQTLIWAAIKGDDGELAATLVFADGAREKAEAWRMALPVEMRQKYAVLEKLPGLFLTEEIVRKAAGAQILETIEDAPDRVTLRVQTATLGGGIGTAKFPFKRGEHGWGVEIAADMIVGMRKASVKTSRR
jgi:hypothetical protein